MRPGVRLALTAARLGTLIVLAIAASLGPALLRQAEAVHSDVSGHESVRDTLVPRPFESEPCAGVPASNSDTLRAVRIASGLSLPLDVAAPPADPTRLFIVEQGGRIRILRDGNLLPTPFMDLSSSVSCCGERGLLGLAFHPDFASNGWLFVNYTDINGDTVIARYELSEDPDVADPTSGKMLLRVPQPFSNHNGGHLAFGPDGYLYAGLGDGGSAGDPQENGQSDSTLLGKLLRIDVDVDGPPYHAVPPDNPEPAAGSPLGLVWATGLRNPWRFSFDREAGDLYIADVGQNQWEEIDVQPAASAGGENYGWDVFEGNHCFDPAPHFSLCPEPPSGFTMPVHEYSHADGCSITGGHVYRGCRMPWLRGTYFYGDYCSAFVRSFVYADGTATNHLDWTEELARDNDATVSQITCFGEDARGELYVCDRDGEIFQLVPGPPPVATVTPTGTPTATAIDVTSTPTPTGAATHTVTSPSTPTRSAVVTPTSRPTRTPTEPSCTGDCDGDRIVEVSELVRGVNLALSGSSPDSCPALDRSEDGRVTIDELVLAVRAAVAGCPVEVAPIRAAA